VDAFVGENLVVRFGDFEMESGRRVLRSRITGVAVALTPRAFDLLLLLVRRPNVLIGKEELISALWPDTVVEDNNLEQAVFALRQALGERRGEHHYIKTIHRRGYQFTAPVTLVEVSQQPEPPVTAVEAPFAPVPRRRIAAVAIGSIVFVIIALFGAWAAWRVVTRAEPHRATLPAENPALAVRYLRAADDEEGQLLAETVTALLEQRLSAIDGLPVIAPESAWSARKVEESPADFGRRMQARFVLGGEVARSGQTMHLEVTLTDSKSGALLWSRVFDRPVTEITAIREEVVAAVTESMRMAPKLSSDAAKAPIQLDVYELYVRGERLMGTADAEKASVLFSRTTVLDPRFARGYLGVAQALMYAHDLAPHLTSVQKADITRQARAAVERALELNPGLGEAWIARARLTPDESQADQMFRRGLRLKPNYTVGAMFYSDFLTAHGRAGESIDVIDRARRLDPMSATLLALQGYALLAARSDSQGSERLFRRALELDGGSMLAANGLVLRLQETGRFAEAIRLLQEMRADIWVRSGMAITYLDMDELPAAIRAWNASDPPPSFQLMVLSQYQRDTASAAQVARRILGMPRSALFGWAAQAVRDQGMATGDHAAALAVLEPVFAAYPAAKTTTSYDREFSIVFAHVLILSGQVERGRRLARSLMVTLEGDEVGRPPHTFSRERAELFALLGENDRALEALAANQRSNHWSHWWYTGELDPIFAHLHADPRFRALSTAAREQRAAQRALLHDMIRRGEVRDETAPLATRH